MAISDLPNVNPGDLITADFINAVIGSIIDLETRVGRLEAGSVTPTGPPLLTSRSPLGDVEVGSQLTLLGRKFAPVASARVTFGPATITSFLPGAGDTSLTFQVPTGLGSLPQTFPVSVSTPQGTSVSLSVRVVAAGGTQGGQLAIVDRSVAQGTIQPNQTYTFQWDVRADTLAPDSYTFAAVFSDVQPSSAASAWQSATTLSAAQATIPPGQSFPVTAQVKVPAGAQSATLTFRVQSVDAAIAPASSNPIPLTVGAAPPVSDPRIQLALQTPGPFDSNGNPNPISETTDASGNPIIQVRFGAGGQLTVFVTVSEAATYRFSSAIEQIGSPPQWTPGAIAPATAQTNPSAGATTVQYGLSNLGSAAAGPGDTFMVVRAAKVNPASNADDYVSFARFHIRGTT